MPVERPALNDKSDVRKLSLVHHLLHSCEQPLARMDFKRLVFLSELRAGICVENVDVFEIVLAVTSPDYVEFAVYKRH